MSGPNLVHWREWLFIYVQSHCSKSYKSLFHQPVTFDHNLINQTKYLVSSLFIVFFRSDIINKLMFLSLKLFVDF